MAKRKDQNPPYVPSFASLGRPEIRLLLDQLADDSDPVRALAGLRNTYKYKLPNNNLFHSPPVSDISSYISKRWRQGLR